MELKVAQSPLILSFESTNQASSLRVRMGVINLFGGCLWVNFCITVGMPSWRWHRTVNPTRKIHRRFDSYPTDQRRHLEVERVLLHYQRYRDEGVVHPPRECFIAISGAPHHTKYAVVA